MWPWHQTSENPYLQQFSISYFPLKEDDEGEEGDEDDDDDGSEMELDEDYPDMNASPLVRFERFDREDDLIIEFDNMFSSASKIQGLSWVLSLDSYTLNQSSYQSDTESTSFPMLTFWGKGYLNPSFSISINLEEGIMRGCFCSLHFSKQAAILEPGQLDDTLEFF